MGRKKRKAPEAERMVLTSFGRKELELCLGFQVQCGQSKWDDWGIGSVQFSCSVVSNSLRSRRLQHARLPCLSPTPRVCSNACPLSQWCHPTISSSVVSSTCLQPFPASLSFPKSQFFTTGGQSIGASASASVLSMNIQDWFPLWLTGLISLLSKGVS